MAPALETPNYPKAFRKSFHRKGEGGVCQVAANCSPGVRAFVLEVSHGQGTNDPVSLHQTKVTLCSDKGKDLKAQRSTSEAQVLAERMQISVSSSLRAGPQAPPSLREPGNQDLRPSGYSGHPHGGGKSHRPCSKQTTTAIRPQR